jgi:hypothetical protein
MKNKSLKDYQLSDQFRARTIPRSKNVPKHRSLPEKDRRQNFDLVPGEPFIRPLPLGWLKQAASLPGRTLAVGLGFWHQMALRSVSRGSEFNASANWVAREFGISRGSVKRGLDALLESKLILRVKTRSGRKSDWVIPATLAESPQSSRLKDDHEKS